MGGGASKNDQIQSVGRENGVKSDKKVTAISQGCNGCTSDERENRAKQTDHHVTELEKREEDVYSIDSKDSDDTFGLASRMSHYVSNGQNINDDTENGNCRLDNELIEIIAKENLAAYDSPEKLDDKDKKETGTNGISKSNNNVLNRTTKHNSNKERNVNYEIDTIGYYITVANNDAVQLNNDNDVSDEKKTVDLNGDDNDTQNNKNKNPHNDPRKEKKVDSDHTDDHFEKFQKLYGDSRRKLPKKPKISKRQTLVLAKVGKQFKYVAVPAYLPGQKIYNTDTVKGYLHRSAEVKPMSRKGRNTF